MDRYSLMLSEPGQLLLFGKNFASSYYIRLCAGYVKVFRHWV